METNVNDLINEKPFYEKKKFPFVVTSGFILGYIAISSSFWHIGYWSTFSFNYFEYSSLTDLFKATIFPLLRNIGLFIFLMFFALYSTILLTNIGFPLNPRITKKTTTEKGQLHISHYYILLAVLFCFLIFLIINNTYSSLMGIFPLLIITFTLIILQSKIISQNFQGNRWLLFMIIFLISYPIYNFWIAKKTALRVYYNYNYQYISQLKLKDSSMEKNFLNQAFLGCTEKYTFVLSPKKSIYVLNNEEIKLISLENASIDSNRIKVIRAKGVIY